jgi:hypothetical protein
MSFWDALKGCNVDPAMACTYWQMAVGCPCSTGPSSVAPVGVPANLTLPPASGQDATNTINALVNQQMIDQQNLNASQVNSTWMDLLLGGASQVPSVTGNWLVIGLIGIGVVGVFTLLGDKGPRRYGR